MVTWVAIGMPSTLGIASVESRPSARSCAGVRRLARQAVFQSRRNASRVAARAAAAPTPGNRLRARASRLRAISDTSETSVEKTSAKADAARGADAVSPAPPSRASGSDEADEANQNLIATAFPLVAVGLLVGIGQLLMFKALSVAQTAAVGGGLLALV